MQIARQEMRQRSSSASSRGDPSDPSRRREAPREIVEDGAGLRQCPSLAGVERRHRAGGLMAL